MTDSEPELIGRFLCGRYRVVERIGEGGMGVVYRAWDERMVRDVALKVLPPGAVADEVTRERFRREAVLPAGLSHPNVCQVYDLDACDGIDCLLLEHIPGPTLAELIAAGPLPEAEVLRLGEQLATGMAATHGRHLLHRDLKPKNLKVTADGTLKIIDFGLARYFGEGSTTMTPSLITPLTDSRMIVGTYHYMAPEILAGSRGDERSDVYSAGVVLYQMGTGHLPFPQTERDLLTHAVLNTEAPPLHTLRPGMSKGLARVIDQAMRKDPGERYASARELADALARLRQGAPLAPRLLAGAALVLALVFLALWARERFNRFGGGGWTAPHRVAIAVLPLANNSGDPAQDKLAVGMTNEIIDALTRIDGLDVAPWEAVAALPPADRSPATIGKRLGIDAYVGGAFSVFRDQVRISAHVVRGPDWRTAGSSLRYDGRLADVMALHDSVAQAIAIEVHARLSSADRRRLALPRGAVQPLAYQLYLAGLAGLSSREEPSLRASVTSFQRAIELDPNFAPPHTGLANAYYRLASEGFVPARNAMPPAEAEARRAIALNPALAEGHSILGAILADYDWSWSQARTELERALELSPGDATAHQRYADLLTTQGHFGEAVDHIQRAIDLDPVSEHSAFMKQEYAAILMAQGKYGRAIEQLRRLIQEGRSSPGVLGNLGLAYWRADSSALSVAAFAQAWRASGVPEEDVTALNRAYAESGMDGVWRTQLDRLSEQADQVPAYQLAALHALLRQNPEAIRWLQESCRRREDLLVGVNVDPRWDGLRGDPGFASVLRCVGLPSR